MSVSSSKRRNLVMDEMIVTGLDMAEDMSPGR
jgi:hypothetical protein